MSQRIKSTYRPRGRGFGRAYPQALVEVEKSEVGPPTERKNVTPGQERKDEGKDEGSSAFPGPSLEAAQQELAEPKPGPEHGDAPEHGGRPEHGDAPEHGDGSDIEEKGLPNPEPMKMLEAGEGKPQI